jgi:SAM-dependent methyltransferase
MNYSTKISERLWNVPDKGELESKREQTFIDDIVQKSHIEKELLSNLNGIKTVFDGGAGSGRFSILLAKHGCKVTHFDISQPMLEDLSGFNDKSFDLVMSFDSPISYTYPLQESVIYNLVRLARKKIMISVTSRLGSLPYLANPIQKNQFILDENCDDAWVKWCLENKNNAVSSFKFNKAICNEMLEKGMVGNGEDEIRAYESGGTPWPITYSFMPDELKGILEECGVKNICLAGPGAYARTIPNELLVKIMKDQKQRADFLDFCYQFDSNPFVCGMGKDNLFAKGDISNE